MGIIELLTKIRNEQIEELTAEVKMEAKMEAEAKTIESVKKALQKRKLTIDFVLDIQKTL